MTLDTRLIDEQIKRLQDLKRIAADPEAVRLFQQILLGQNGHVETPETVKDSKYDSIPETPRRGTLIETVLRVVNSSNKPVEVNSVVEEMLRMGFQFAASRPKVAVGIALRKLESKGRIRLLTRGRGSSPNIYTRLEVS